MRYTIGPRYLLLAAALLASAAAAQDNLKFGNPGCVGNDREEGDRKYYYLCHSIDLKVPLWVGYELVKTDLDGPAERPSGFHQDRLLKHPGAKDSDYAGSKYSRGHMAPAEDFSRSDEAIRTTFALSNVVPQFQGVNGGRWSQLELAVRNLVKDAGAAYIFTGPLFAKPEVDTIGDDEVGVPTHTFKVVLAVWPDGQKKAYAVIMPNAESVTAPVNKFVTTVRTVEKRTGFDFFNALEDAEEKRLETRKVKFPEPKKKAKPAGHK
jgi:endonuclease G, mitochondrial